MITFELIELTNIAVIGGKVCWSKDTIQSHEASFVARCIGGRNIPGAMWEVTKDRHGLPGKYTDKQIATKLERYRSDVS